MLFTFFLAAILQQTLDELYFMWQQRPPHVQIIVSHMFFGIDFKNLYYDAVCFFNFTQFVIVENCINFGLGTVKSERIDCSPSLSLSQGLVWVFF